MYELGLNPYLDVLSEARYRELFGQAVKHPFTGIDYVQMYRELVAGGEGRKLKYFWLMIPPALSCKKN